MATQGFCSLEWRVQFCLLVCGTYPSLLTVNKEKNQTDQRASLRVDTRETQQEHAENPGNTSHMTSRKCHILQPPSSNHNWDHISLCFCPLSDSGNGQRIPSTHTLFPNHPFKSYWHQLKQPNTLLCFMLSWDKATSSSNNADNKLWLRRPILHCSKESGNSCMKPTKPKRHWQTDRQFIKLYLHCSQLSRQKQLSALV